MDYLWFAPGQSTPLEEQMKMLTAEDFFSSSSQTGICFAELEGRADSSQLFLADAHISPSVDRTDKTNPI
jgi:hypothetical protein